MVLPAPNSMKVLELVKNDKTVFNNIVCVFDLAKLKVNVLEANSSKTRNLYKNPHRILFY